MIGVAEHHRPRLLAIDHSPLIHRLLKARLRNERLEIHCATTGAKGLEAAKKLLPEVILLDVDMCDMDGYSVLELLKSDTSTHDIPVIVVSASSDTASKIRAFDMGAIDFVPKPFDLGELKARVRSAVRVRLLISMLAQRAQIDGLTGLWNRAHFDQRLHDEISSAQRNHQSLSLVLCDLDDFKRINDTYGHPFGDQVLEEFAAILAGGRSSDVACRYGGEEFAVILPRQTADEAAMVARRFRSDLRERTWNRTEGLAITASFGVTDLARVEATTVNAMVQSADGALYRAKEQGKDRVVMAPIIERDLRASA
jgi:two-component system cell cycle response regulator